MSKILVSGHINIETTLKINKFPLEYFPVEYPFFGINSTVSGVGYNISKAFNTLGDDVDFITVIGKDDSGERVINEFKKCGINTDYIHMSVEQTSQSVIIFDKNGKRQIHCDLKDIQDRNIDIEYDKLSECDLAVIGNINFNRSLLKKAKEAGVTIATDVHVLSDIDDEYNQDFLRNADIIFLSDEGIKGNCEYFIKSIKEKFGAKIIVLGCGDKGAMLYERKTDTITLLPAKKVKDVVNTIGAGDSLFSAFLHYYCKGTEPLVALEKAQCFAANKIRFNGAAEGFVSEKELEKLCKQQY